MRTFSRFVWLLGALSGFSGSDLGGFAIKAALERGGVAPEQVDYVIMGQVLTAGVNRPGESGDFDVPLLTGAIHTDRHDPRLVGLGSVFPRL